MALMRDFRVPHHLALEVVVAYLVLDTFLVAVVVAFPVLETKMDSVLMLHPYLDATQE